MALFLFSQTPSLIGFCFSCLSMWYQYHVSKFILSFFPLSLVHHEQISFFSNHFTAVLHFNQGYIDRTLPAGYLEVGESTAEGASRETLEEACADVEIVSPFAQLDIPLIGQVSENWHSYKVML